MPFIEGGGRWPSAALLALAGLGAACSSGGGGGGAAVSFSFALPSASLAEDDAALGIEVVLHTSLAALVDPATVDVADRGTGSAMSGSDYAAFSVQSVTFPAGAVDGDRQVVALSPINDLLFEGASETIRLALQAPVGGALASPSTFAATLDDVHVAAIAFASPVSSTPDESSTSRSVALELDLTPGATLGVAVGARVADLRTGDATPAVDYGAFAAQTVTFPVGSGDGTLRTVAVVVLDDATPEADESVMLGLSAPSGGASLGGNDEHALSITDDDQGTGRFTASAGPTGVENALSPDELLDLGQQGVGAGPNSGTLVRVANTGSGLLLLGAPQLSGAAPNDFAVEIDSPSTAALVAERLLSALDVSSPFVERVGAPGPGIALELDAGRLRDLAPLKDALLHDFPVPDLGTLTLGLRREPLPVSEDCLLVVDGEPVAGGVRGLVGDLQLWSGEALELPGSRVFLAFSSAGARGFLELPLPRDRHVHVLTERESPGAIRIVRSSGLAALGLAAPESFCQKARLVPGRTALPQAPVPGKPGTSALTISGCRLALETDYQLYQRFGSSSELTTYVTELIAAISAQYYLDVQTRLLIAYLGIHTSADDGWDAQENGGTVATLLDEFMSAWSSGWPAAADLAHFLSGAVLGGGIAYVDVLCEQGFGFGVSANVTGNIDWDTWTGQPSHFAWDFVVVAHEIGHNFGSEHTHAYCPPLDLCGANCTGTTACSQGTIMSYCHTCGGMDNIDLRFHPVTANIMRQSVNLSCLQPTRLSPGDSLQYLVRFNPLTTAGLRQAELQFLHDAANEPQPFPVRLAGTGN
jgi:hypothetical protein